MLLTLKMSLTQIQIVGVMECQSLTLQSLMVSYLMVRIIACIGSDFGRNGGSVYTYACMNFFLVRIRPTRPANGTAKKSTESQVKKLTTKPVPKVMPKRKKGRIGTV